MTQPILTLSAPGLDDLTLDHRDGWIVQREFDAGDAVVRAVAENAPGADGEIDSTTLTGGRSVVIPVVIEAPSPSELEAMERRLRAFTNARLRPTLTLTRPGGPAKQIQVRHASWTAQGIADAATLVVWETRAPSGIWEAATETFFEVAASEDATDGIDWPIDWPIDWGSPSSPGLIEVTNDGDRDAFPVLHLHGAWSDETRVQNLTTGRELVFDGLSVTDGDYLEVDMRAATVFLNGDPAESRLGYRVFPESSFWALAPGVNVLRFLAETSSSPARMAGRFRAAYG